MSGAAMSNTRTPTMLMSVYAARSSQHTDKRNAHVPLFSRWPSTQASEKTST